MEKRFKIIVPAFNSRIKSYLKLTQINNFEDWVIDKFGKKLYLNFFKNYTEKVWGIECKDIGKDWAAQRIKGLSLSSAIKNAFFPNSKNRPKSLVDSFYYPKLGAGMLWEKFENIVQDRGVEIKKETEVIEVKKKNNYFEVVLKSQKGTETVNAKHIFFSNPLLKFIEILDSDTPNQVIEACNKLKYRNHISVHLCIDQKLFKDNWIYIHSPDLKVARISDFTNFSSFMAPKGTYTITVEYFCFEDDSMWLLDQEKLIEFANSELKEIFNSDYKLIHSAVSKNKNAYPVINIGYESEIETIKKWIKNENSIFAIGRSGMFKYNNQDHAMATGLSAVRRYLGDKNYDPWDVNVDGEYHESLES